MEVDPNVQAAIVTTAGSFITEAFKSAIDYFKSKKPNDLEAAKVLNELVRAQLEISTLLLENDDLKRKLTVKQKCSEKDGKVFTEGSDTPYCLTCYHSNKMTALTPRTPDEVMITQQKYECTVCETKYK